MVRRAPSLGQRGMTLVEICIAVLVAVMAVAVVVPAIGNVTRADLRSGANGLAATVRYCYDQAALSGQTYRLVLTPGSNALRIDATDAAITFDGVGEAVAAAEQLPNDLDAYDIGGADPHAAPKVPPPSSGGGFIKGLQGLQKLAAVSDGSGFSEVKKAELPSGVLVFDVWSEQSTVAQKGAAVSLLFFPDGYTQDAIVHLQDTAERMMSVKVAALTGRCTIEAGYVEASR